MRKFPKNFSDILTMESRWPKNRAIDVVEDRSRQPALGERTEIMKIMTVAHAHIVPRITRTRGKA